MPAIPNPFSPAGVLKRKGFALTLVGVFALSYLPGIVLGLLETPPEPWFIKGPVYLILAYVLLCAIIKRLRDTGLGFGRLSLFLALIGGAYVFLASPLAGFVPLPDALTTLGLILANGALFAGLVFLLLAPSRQ